MWEKIKNPRGFWLALFYVVFSFVALGTILLVVFVPDHTVWHYILYGVAALMLAYFVYTMVVLIPIIKEKIIKILEKHKLTNAILKDYGFRTTIFSGVSFVLNVLYIAFVAVMAFLSRTAWYFSITVYYVILAVMKGNIIRSKQKHGTVESAAKTFRFTGIMFIIIPIIFSGVILLIYKANHYFEYAGLLIYAVAAFTFYKLVVSIINFVKVKQHGNLYLEGMRNINLASSLISIIVLQVAMFQAFSPTSNSGIANALTGAGVSLIILVVGILMIIKANRILKNPIEGKALV